MAVTDKGAPALATSAHKDETKESFHLVLKVSENAVRTAHFPGHREVSQTWLHSHTNMPLALCVTLASQWSSHSTHQGSSRQGALHSSCCPLPLSQVLARGQCPAQRPMLSATLGITSYAAPRVAQKSKRMPQMRGPCTHVRASEAAGFPWPSPGYYGHLESEPTDQRSLCLSLCNSAFQTKINL